VRPLAFLVPGALDQLTGGYLFARRIVAGLRAGGRAVGVHELAGRFPDCDRQAEEAAAAALAALPDDHAAVIDGLALPALRPCLASAAKRLRLLGFVHHPLALETGLAPDAAARFASIEGALLPLLRGVLCPSAATAAALKEYGLPDARIAVAPPGTLKPATLPPRRADKCPLDLLTVATITPRKGHLVLIEALASLPRDAWRLRCIGSLTREPAYVGAVRAAIAAYRLEDRIALDGERPPERLGEAYAAASVFVLPSYHEGYGMAFAEALAHGLPIVATRAGAIPTTVPEEAGLLVPPGDPPALASALARLIADDGLRRRLAAAAALSGRLLPDWDASACRWIAAADRLLGDADSC
jgi:glycosyltransferase involved in cell wall biosynthesis